MTSTEPSSTVPNVPSQPTIANTTTTVPPITTTTVTSASNAVKAALSTTSQQQSTAPSAIPKPVIPNPSAVRPAPPPAASAALPSAAARSAPTTTATTSKSKKKKSSVVSMVTNTASSQSSQGNQGENTGRWTAEEHRLFLQGLEQHGKGWKKIASLIKSRTVVQIRTHAQKYFQKLSKARQNGEDGDVTMEGRGGVSSVASVCTSTAVQNGKRRRQQTSGTKRKAIQSVVASAQKQGKKMAAAQAAAGVPDPVPPLPAVAPALANFVLPNLAANNSNGITSSSSSQASISGPALEDSLFRFLTLVPVALPEPQVNEVARQAGANPISLPTDNPSSAPSFNSGDISPTGVADLALYPTWTDAKDIPSWYAKGADVDALLDVADSLDWLADSGDNNETYQPPAEDLALASKSGVAQAHNNSSVSSFADVSSSVDADVPPLPSLFGNESSISLAEKKMSTSSHLGDLGVVVAGAAEVEDPTGIEEHLEVFDTPLDEQDFVSTILEEETTEVSEPLPALS